MGLRGNSAGDCLSVVSLGEMGRDDGGSVGGGTSFLLAAESTKGGRTAEEWFSWGIVAESSMWVVRRVGAPDDVVL